MTILQAKDFDTLDEYHLYCQSLEREDDNDNDLEYFYMEGDEKLTKSDVVAAVQHSRRKARPVYSGFVAYFPDAMLKVSELSLIANEQHHPGTPLHWDKTKSQDHNDCIIRHMIDDVKGRKTDSDDVWHKTKVAWRAMAELQEECDRVSATKGT